MADQTRKQTLTAELDTARTHLAGYMTALRHDLSVGARLKSGVARNPLAWFGAAAVIGLVLSRISLPGRKVVIKGPAIRNDQAAKAGKAAFVLTALKFGLDFAKPMIMTWIKNQMLNRKASRSASVN